MITIRVSTPDDQIVTRINATLQEAKEYYIAHLGTVTVEEIKEEKEISKMKNTANKTLYFEGAGWKDAESSTQTDVGNCRIRTAFTNDDNQEIYLEMGNTYRYTESFKPIDNKGTRIDHLFNITGGNDDCNESRIPFDYQELRAMDYTKANLLKWINENLNCSFDDIEVLHSAYRVHGEHRSYNLMDNIA